LFAFFNSGDHSGASQPHRHLQFLPLENMVHGSQTSGWVLLLDLILAGSDSFVKGTSMTLLVVHKTQLNAYADAPAGVLQHPSLPFTHFAYRLPSDPTGSQLLDVYNRLYQLSRRAIDDYMTANPTKLTLHDTSTGSLPISYNLAMTTVGMAILPRLSEGANLRRDDGTEVGFVALNGTALGGTLMVKQEEQWNLLRQQPEKLDYILRAIGIPTSS
jgi:ATP adenylyltransferase